MLASRITNLVEQRPKWDANAGGHVLNFHGRVTESSVKNFQLACDETGDETVLQFGRISNYKDRFTLDCGYPLSPLQAFATVLASLDGKVADSRGYDAMQKIARRLSATEIDNQ